MSENIKKRKILSSAQNEEFLKRKELKNPSRVSDGAEISLSKLEDSKNLNVLGKIAAMGTSLAHKRALEISDEIICVKNGQIIKKIKGEATKVLENISPRKVTKGDVLIIKRSKS